MASIPELMDGHVTLEVECLDRLYLNGYIGGLATPGGLVTFMRVQLDKPIPSPVLLGQVSERFRDAVKARAERQQIPFYKFRHKERKDDVANKFRRRRGVRDQIVFIGVAQEKARAFSGTKVNGHFRFVYCLVAIEPEMAVDLRSAARRSTAISGSIATRQYTSTITTSTLMTRTSGRCSSRCAAMRHGGSNCASTGMSGPNGNWISAELFTSRSTTGSSPVPNRNSCNRSVIPWDRNRSTAYSASG